MTNSETKFLLYKTENSNISIDVIISNETLWTTQKINSDFDKEIRQIMADEQ
ncbi:hypothetical protein [Latilactobacillus curvatus]|uniref:hypothetical protein n=1 Tax=Latilactobacillus curvatus TaxID=28038 RepID=UPI000B030473|nr:hypothetical protein [Latilactobacillus curvatus]